MISKRRTVITVSILAVALAGGAFAWSTTQKPAAQPTAAQKAERPLELIAA